MGEMFRCPLCCGEEFSCRKTLKAHLQSYMESFTCLICSEEFDSIPDLINHLDGDCRERINKHSEDLDVKPQLLIELNPLLSKDNVEVPQGRNQEIVPTSLMAFTLPEKPLDNNSEKAVDDEIHSQEDMMTMMHMIDGTNNRYVIMSGDGTSILTGDMLTTQNSDGTISITSLKDENQGLSQLEENAVSQDQDTEVGLEGAELYTCNTCGVTFTSVVEHIQTYHNDQDVVLEMAEPSNSLETQTLASLVKTSTVTTNDENIEKIDPSVSTKRVITDAGNIVETHFARKTVDKGKTKRTNSKKSKSEQICLDKTGRPYTRKLVQVDKFWKESSQKSPQKEKEELDKEINTTNKNMEPPFASMAERERRMIIMSMTSLDGSSMKVFQCTRCRVHFLTQDDFERHDCTASRPTDSKVAVKEMTVLDQQAMYHCPMCSMVYTSSKSLCAHMKVHKNVKANTVSQENNTKGTPGKATVESAKKLFKCEVCDTIFPTNKSLRLHRRMHDPVKNRPVDPPVQYGSEGAQTGDVSPDMFHCEECDKWIHEGYRDIHTNYHRSTQEHNCDICNRKFPSLDYLIMHMNVHNTEKLVAPNKPDKTLPYKCLYCTRKFARPHEKVKHERIHTGEKPHSCEICGKSFRVSYCLTLHMRTHTGARPYACPYCEKRFKAHSVFNHHLLTHSNVRAYKCPFCPKAFKTSVQLAGHKNSHTKPFSCTQCNRPFASLYAVRVHTETHGKSHNNLKFSCALCGASYARAFALKDHVRQQHPEGAAALEDAPAQTQYILPTGKEEWPTDSGDRKPGEGPTADEAPTEPDKADAPEPMALEVEELAIGTEDGSREVIM